MQRYNIFNQIHKGLRVLLFDTATVLQQTDFTDLAQTDLAIEKVNKVLEMFKNHGDNEDEYILSLLKNADPGIASRFEEEHEIDENAARHLQSIIDYLLNTTDTNLRLETGRNLCYSFNEFVAFNLYHMNKEEIHLNPLLWNLYTDDQIRAISMRVVEKISPEENAFASYWMIKGMNNIEIAEWLKAVRAGAPPEAFQGLMQIAEIELHVKRFKSLKDALTETPMSNQ